MKRNKVKRIALAAALVGTMVASAPHYAFAQSASGLMATLSSQVRVADFAGSRATIQELQQLGIGAIKVGNDTITLEDLLAMIDAAEAGRMDPVALAVYLDALATNTAQALFIPGQGAAPTQYPTQYPTGFPTGSEG